MPYNSGSDDKVVVGQAQIGIVAPTKSLQQVLSSGQAARNRREENNKGDYSDFAHALEEESTEQGR
ncbi:hypothetical protein N7493_005941 [Penicillium malachiteum]|uniref:Uncharacterized protein n=1 Tax=Penicillium malachiteum TaxID=1324776 RepID=A0AAD6MVX9_9EURO|nr:hypothetical protein N7493_005941 [Penicillium malachiteum]